MRKPAPSAVADFCTSLRSTLQAIGKKAVSPLSEGDLCPDKDDDAGWEALRLAERQLLDAHQVQCGRTSVGFRDIETRLTELSGRVSACVAADTPVSAEDIAALKDIGQLLEKRPLSEDRGDFEADIATLPMSTDKGIEQLLSTIRVSLRLPSTSAHLQVANIALQADVRTGDEGPVARLGVRFQAYLRGQQGDSLADMLQMAKVRLAIPNHGPMELPLQLLKRVTAEPTPVAA